MPRAKRRISAGEFEAIRPLLNISSDRVEAARLVIVDNRTLKSVGDEFRWTRQAVNDSVAVVWRVVEKYRESQRAAANVDTLLPPGWEIVTLVAPSCLVEKFRVEIAQVTAKKTA